MPAVSPVQANTPYKPPSPSREGEGFHYPFFFIGTKMAMSEHTSSSMG